MTNEILEEYINEKLNINNMDAVNYSIDSIKLYYDKFVDITQSKDDQAIDLFKDFEFEQLLESCNNLSSRHVPYSRITDLVFKEEKEYSSTEMREIATFPTLFKGAFLEWLEKEYSSVGFSDDITKEEVYGIKDGGDTKSLDEKFKLSEINKNLDGIENIYKIIEHLELAIKQKQGLYDKQKVQLEEFDSKIYEFDLVLKGYDDDIEGSLKVVNQIKEDKNQIYTQFVAILGIFTSIMFALIGGFNELTTLAMSVKDTPVPKLLIFMSLLMLGITLLVFMSYSAVSKLTGLKLKSCQCSDDEECRCLFREKHPTVFYTSFFLICIMMTGFLLGAFYDKNPKINPTIDLAHINGYIIPLVLLMIFMIIVSVLIYKIVFSKQLELPREISIEDANYHINKLNNRMIALWVVVTILLGLTIIQLIL